VIVKALAHALHLVAAAESYAYNPYNKSQPGTEIEPREVKEEALKVDNT